MGRAELEFRVYVDVNGRGVDFTLDTGSDVTIITETTSRDLRLELTKPSRYLVGADSTPLNVVGESVVELNNKGLIVSSLASIIKNATRNLLGIVEIRSLNLLAIVNSIRPSREAFDPYKVFKVLFEGLGTMPDVYKIVLRSDVKPYKIRTPRPIAIGLREKARSELQKMLELKVIEQVEQPTDWCSGLTIVPKPNGNIRMCVDLTMLNRGVEREFYPLPRVSDMLSQLSTGRLFSKLDANSGFWQIVLAPESRALTTFLTPWGRFQFRRLPFGLSSAPEIFQRSMEKILDGLEGVVCMMDDVLVFGTDADEHWCRLRLVLERIQNSGMTLKKEKCEFGVTEIKFLGHIICLEGVKLDPDKAKTIMDISPPTCKREAKRFLGMVNYLNKFSSKLAELCSPIYETTSIVPFYWGLDQQVAFEEIKKELSSAPVLCAFDVRCRHKVSADSSRIALGAVLLQFTDDEAWQPVEYASRKLLPAEKNYAMVELEALGITWACEKFDFYLVGRKFEVETDHKPLISLLGEKDLSQLPLRVQRFKMRLMRYDFSISHTPGNCMYIADFLSRPCNPPACEDRDIAECGLVEFYVAHNMKRILTENFQERELLQAIFQDATCIELKKYISLEWPADVSVLSSELRKLYQVRESLTLYGDIIMYESRLFIPTALRNKYLVLCHEGHQGITKCQRRARQIFWWPGCSRDIEDFISRCDDCIKFSRVKHQPIEDFGLPDGPWLELGSDTLEFKGQWYLLVVDYYTTWIEVRPLLSLSSYNVIQEFKSIFSCFGIPALLRSDNAGCYASESFRNFAQMWGFDQRFSSPRYPESNGLAERSVGTFKSLLKKSDDIYAALLAYRATPLASGFSPGELMFGRPMKTPLGHPKDVEVNYKEFEKICIQKRKDAFHKWNQKHHAKYLPELTEGQLVFVKAPTDKGQEGVIVRKDEFHPQSYWVQVGDSILRRNRKHLYVLQEQADNESGDTILPMALDWYFDSSGDNACRDHVEHSANPGVSFDLEPVVHVLPYADLSSDALVDGSLDPSSANGNGIPNPSEASGAEFGAGSNESELSSNASNPANDLQSDTNASDTNETEDMLSALHFDLHNPVPNIANDSHDNSAEQGAGISPDVELNLEPELAKDVVSDKPSEVVTKSGRKSKSTKRDDSVYFKPS